MKKTLTILAVIIIIAIIIIPIIIFLSKSNEVNKQISNSGPNPTVEYQKFVNDKNITRIYRGTLPCKDCDGAETVISISQKEDGEQSGNFSNVVTFFGTDKDAQVTSGKWNIQKKDGEKVSLLVLNFSDGSIQYYKWINDETLVKLDNDKSSFPNEKKYTLKLL